MKLNGLFWSAVIRALLGIRRDQEINTDIDISALNALVNIESANISRTELDEMLNLLCPSEHHQLIGEKLGDYLDFNHMGNTALYFTALKDIEECLQALCDYGAQFFDQDGQFQVDQSRDQVVLRWQSQHSDLTLTFQLYFLICLLRHLAGRHFDVISIGMGDQGTSGNHRLLSALSQGQQLTDQSPSLCLKSQWLHRPSFFYSARLKEVLKPQAADKEQKSLKQQILETFQRNDNPARIRAEWVAQQLNMNESALRRALRQHNISFSGLLKDYIHDLSCQKLLCGEKAENVAHELGFSDRRSLDRSFKEHTGISAGQLRLLGNRLRFQRGNQKLLETVDHFPPLPATVQALINLDKEHTTLESVVELVKQDPIFHAHIMSKASRAVYGGLPRNLEQAIARNLGLENIKHLALLFAAQQILTQQCRFPNIQNLTDSMLLSERLYAKVFTYQHTEPFERELVQQMLLFGTLSLFLVFHEECVFAEGALKIWHHSEDYVSFSESLSDQYGICLYGATTLMLMRWGYGSELNQTLWKLCQSSEGGQVQSVTQQIHLCHQVAFSALAFQPSVSATSAAPACEKELCNLLSASQQQNVRSTIESWRAVA